MSGSHRIIKGWMVILLLLLELGYSLGVMLPASRKLAQISDDHSAAMLDTKPYYDGTTAYAVLDAKGSDGRAWCKVIATRHDFIFPLVYGPFLAAALVFLFQYSFPQRRGWGWLILLPLLGVAFDYTENHFIVQMIDGYPARNLALGSFTGKITLVKWILAGGSMLLCFSGFLLFLHRKFNSPHH